jgi:TRAP-type C4-dicarboxylate transport system permease small subunit
MSGRTVALVGTLLFVALLGVLTIDVIARTGVDVLVVVALAVLAMVGFGVLGALLNPPQE